MDLLLQFNYATDTTLYSARNCIMYLIGQDVLLLHLQICGYKANHPTDTTVHRIKNCCAYLIGDVVHLLQRQIYC